MSDDIDMDFNDDMMDGFDDFDSFDNPESDSGSRNPITNVAAGAMDRVLSTDTASKLTRTLADNALPKGFSIALDRADDIGSAAADLYESTAKELKGPIKDLKKLVNGSIESATWLPKSVRDKLFAATKADETISSERVDPRELEMQEASNRIFAGMAQQTAETNASNAIASSANVKAQMASSFSLLTELKKANGFQQITQEYQRKDLELSFRSFYALKDLVEDGRASSADLKSYLEAIKTNTGLPDIQKTLTTEEYMQGITDNLTGSFGETAGDYLRNFGGNLKKNIGVKLRGITDSITDIVGAAKDVGGVVDDVSGLDEDTKLNILGGEIAGLGIPFLGEKASKRLAKIVANNPDIAEKSNNLIYLSENYPNILKRWLGSKAKDSSIAEQMLELVPTFGGSDISLGNNLSSGIMPTTFTNISDNSLNVVIPGYLARLVQQAERIADHVGADEKDLLTYSRDRQDFEYMSEAKKRTNGKLTDTGSEKQAAFDQIFSVLDPKGKMSKGERERLAKFLFERAANAEDFNVDDLASGENGSKELDSFFAKLGAKDGGAKTLLNKDISRELKRLNGGFKENSATVNQMFNTGQRDVLASMGLITVAKDGSYKFNNEKMKSNIIAGLDLNKVYEDKDGNKLTGNIVKSKSDLAEEERKRLEKEKKESKKSLFGNKDSTDGEEESDGLLSTALAQAKDKIETLSSEAYDSLPPELKADLELAKLKAQEEYQRVSDIIVDGVSTATKTVKESKTYTDAEKFISDKKDEIKKSKTYTDTEKFLNDKKDEIKKSKVGEVLIGQDGVTDKVQSLYESTKKSYENGELTQEAALAFAQKTLDNISKTDISYTANKKRVLDLKTMVEDAAVTAKDEALRLSESAKGFNVDSLFKGKNEGGIQDIAKGAVLDLQKQGLNFAPADSDIEVVKRLNPLKDIMEQAEKARASIKSSFGDITDDFSSRLPEDVIKHMGNVPSMKEFKAMLPSLNIPTKGDIEESYNKALDFVSNPNLIMDLQDSVQALGGDALKEIRDSNIARVVDEKLVNLKETIANRKKLDLSGEGSSKSLQEIMDANKPTDARAFFENLKDEASTVISESIQSGVSALDFAKISDEIAKFVDTAKADLMLDNEALKINNFMEAARGIPKKAPKLTFSDSSDIPYVPNDPVESLDSDFTETKPTLSALEIIALGDVVKGLGKDVIDNFKMAIGIDSSDTINSIPVRIEDGEAPEGSIPNLIDVNVQGFQTIFEALGEVNTSIIAAAAASDAVPGGTKDVLLNSLGGLFKNVATGTGSLFTSYFKGASKLTGTFFGGIGSAGGKIAKGVTGGLNTVLTSGQSDIFVSGNTKPAMYAKNLIAGDYTDVKTGKVVRSVGDVTGQVIDKDGNTVITEEEYAQGLFALDNGSFGSALKLVSSPFRLAFKAQANLIGAVLSVPKAILTKVTGMFSKPYDVYVGEESKPRLLAIMFKNGGYRSNNTGKLLKHPDDIDGEVADLNGDVIVSNDDIREGLFTRYGRKVGSSRLWEYTKKLVGGTIGLAYRSTIGAAKLGLRMGKGILNGGASAIVGTANAGLRALGLSKTGGMSGEFAGGETLDNIYLHMQKRWPIDGHDGGQETDERMVELQEEIAEALTADKPNSNDADGDGDRDGGWRDILSRRKKTAPDNTPEAKAKKEEDDGFLAGLASLIMPLIGAIGTGFSALLGFLGLKKAGDIAGDMADGYNPDIDVDKDEKKKKGTKPKGKGPKPKGKFGRLAQGAKNLFSKGGSKAAGNVAATQGAKTAAKIAGKQAVKFGAKKALIVGAGAVAALAGGIALAPFIAAAGLAYTVWEVGTFFAGRTDLEPLEKLRYMQYGVPENYTLISLIRNLESDLEDEVNYGNRPSLNTPIDEIVEDHAEDFGVDMNDPKQVTDFAHWYSRRFTPVFLIHANAAHQIDKGIDITDVDDEMDGKDNKVTFIRETVFKAKVLSRNKIYEIVNEPMPGVKMLSNENEVKEYAKSLMSSMGTEYSPLEGTVPTKGAAKASGKRPEDIKSPAKTLEASGEVNERTLTSSEKRNRKRIETIRGRVAAQKLRNGSGRELGILGLEGDSITLGVEGELTMKGSEPRLGHYVTIKHDDGRVSTYYQMGDVSEDINVGDFLPKGTILGYYGAKGEAKWFLKDSKGDVKSAEMKKVADKESSGPLSITGSRPLISTSTKASRVTALGINMPKIVPIPKPAKDKEAGVVEDKTALFEERFLNKVNEAISATAKSGGELAHATEQRNAMITNQGLMISELRVIADALTTVKSNRVSSSPPPLRKVNVPVPLKKGSQF